MPRYPIAIPHPVGHGGVGIACPDWSPMPAFQVQISGDGPAAAQLVDAITKAEKNGPIVSVVRVDDQFVIVTQKKPRATRTGPQETR